MKKAITFFADKHILPGLHATLLSMLDSLDESAAGEIRIFLYADGIPEDEKALLRKTHAINPKGTEFNIEDFNPTAPEGANSLHGNMTTYGRLHLPDLLAEYDQCLYLDSDLLINVSVHELFDRFDGAHVLLADGMFKRESSLDRKLYETAKIDLSGNAFNAGVLGIDLGLWRREKVGEQCAEAARKYAGQFLSADQALLNVVLHDRYLAFGDIYNKPVFPFSERANPADKRVFHFVGSPKPWDVFGSLVHSNHRLWKDVYRRTAIGSRSPWRYASSQRVVRTFKSTVQALMRRTGLKK